MGELVPLPVRRHEAPQEPARTSRRDAKDEPASGVEPLWRESVGRELRRERLASGRRLVDVAGDAGVSPQYLSEVERGLKDPSSELLAAMAGALGLSVGTVARRVGSTAPHSPRCLAA